MFGQLGPDFPRLKQEDWKSIYDYIQMESDRLNLSLPSHAYLTNCVDSCEAYNKTVNHLKGLKSMSLKDRKKLIDSNGSMVTNENFGNLPPVTSGTSTPTPPPPVFEDLVSPQNFGAQYYQFSIETFGWYNVDILLKNLPGIEPSELLVRIQGEFRERIEVFLIIPSEKVNAEGGPTEKNKDEYAFYNKDGKIPLPQNAKSYILAMTESDGKFAYALHSFNATRQQTITIELKKATKEEFTSAMSVFAGEEIKINVRDAKNAKEIRAKDADLKKINEQLKQAEGLKPKGCDCDCADEYPATVSDTTRYLSYK
jgi:hypothetical protein